MKRSCVCVMSGHVRSSGPVRPALDPTTPMPPPSAPGVNRLPFMSALCPLCVLFLALTPPVPQVQLKPRPPWNWTQQPHPQAPGPFCGAVAQPPWGAPCTHPLAGFGLSYRSPGRPFVYFHLGRPWCFINRPSCPAGGARGQHSVPSRARLDVGPVGGLGKRKTTRSCSPHSHNRLMLSARAPQNHKLNFKCKTTKTVAKQPRPFF